MSEQPKTLVVADANATVDELLANAARDLATAVDARAQLEQQGGTGVREGILPGGDS
ncbi:hypothetical protein [Streptomyces sp. NPDC005760]|uniref:hypothetical protein n=1 Tax=Streptomyces sp. NPDC005760 TaxID=3156718 RepID=UPI0033EA80FF